jgi:hypothetical protein
MKFILLIIFILKSQTVIFAEEAKIISFHDHANKCTRVLRPVRPIKDREKSKDILIYSLLNDLPKSVRTSEFFSEDINPSQVFVFQGQGSPMFGKTGVERWRPLTDATLDFREPIYFLMREITEDGDFKFAQHTRFNFSDEGLAFIEVLEYFRTSTKTVGRGSGADYIEVFRTVNLKEQFRALLQAWAIALDNRTVEDFVYDANQIIGNPEFQTEDPRLVRAYFQKVVELFKERFQNQGGRLTHQYERMLDELERRRLLHFYLLI